MPEEIENENDDEHENDKAPGAVENDALRHEI
jgi:hypothetical protein